jgi:protein gp37
VRFVSAEPLLGPVDLAMLPPFTREAERIGVRLDALKQGTPYGLHWVIVGGESGHRARPMHPDWARSLRDQCQAAGVPFFMKQMTSKAPIPADLMIREFPNV